MAAKKKDKTPKKTKPKTSTGLDAELQREIEKTIRETWFELTAEMGGLQELDTSQVRMPQPAPCDDQFTILVPLIAFGRTKAVAEASIGTKSRLESRNSAAKLQCSSKSCSTTAEACVMDYGHVVMDTQKKTFTTKKGREITLWISQGIHLAGCFCLI